MGKAKGGVVSFGVKWSKDSLAAGLAPLDLTNANVTSAPVTIPLVVLFDGGIYEANVAQRYTAKAGKSGATK